MKVSLRNIGILDEADFEVGDITVICGENNTGKTYATYSLYGFLKFVEEINSYAFDAIDEVSIKDYHLLEKDGSNIKISFENFEKLINDCSNGIEKGYKSNLAEILAGKDGDFNESIFTTNILELFLQDIKDKNFDMSILKNIMSYERTTYFELLDANKEYFIFNYKKNQNFTVAELQDFCMILFTYICFIVYPKAFILSAERTGASMFQKELDVNKNEIVEKISTATSSKSIERTVLDVLRTRYTTYPKPVKDNIYFIRELDQVIKSDSFIKKEDNNLHKEILDILNKIVGGKYIMSAEGIEFAPGAKQRVTSKGKFLIQRASSSVRSLVMLNYYILHKARVGDILMIDEPELNLHPKNQILLARLIVLLSRANIKVFITTHSDYMVHELSNCIMLHNLSEQQIIELKKDYKEEYKLDASKIKAYLAVKEKKKNILKSIKIDQERGIFMNTFNESIDAQNNNRAIIFETILKNKNAK